MFCARYHRKRHSFPTRRSSDLDLALHVRATLVVVTGQWRAGDLLRLDTVETGAVQLTLRGRLRLSGDIRDRLEDRKSTRLNSSHVSISYAVFCLKKKKKVDTAS